MRSNVEYELTDIEDALKAIRLRVKELDVNTRHDTNAALREKLFGLHTQMSEQAKKHAEEKIQWANEKIRVVMELGQKDDKQVEAIYAANGLLNAFLDKARLGQVSYQHLMNEAEELWGKLNGKR